MEPKFFVWMEPECGKFLYFGPFDTHLEAHTFSKSLRFGVNILATSFSGSMLRCPQKQTK